MSAPVAAFIGLGANLGDAAVTLGAAIAALERTAGIDHVRASSLYSTPAWGLAQQPDFVNAVALIQTTLGPNPLLQALLQVERDFGRDRGASQRWGPRTLDLDLLLYADRCIEQPGLSVPHPHLHERAFVLVPLLELDPDVVIPGRGPARDAVLAVATAEIRRLQS